MGMKKSMAKVAMVTAMYGYIMGGDRTDNTPGHKQIPRTRPCPSGCKAYIFNRDGLIIETNDYLYNDEKNLPETQILARSETKAIEKYKKRRSKI